jgi:hypothetical protein
MIPSLLLFLCTILSKKNMCHACSVEKLGGVVPVLVMADFCYFFASERILYKTCI